ncbi:HAD family hydrolase [Streptococcus parauberis]|uniref:HAD family hydrolase n=1 Tax=Streptococcus parauberis TaxID=1348 RepID=UPI000CCEF1D6|nr:HAD family phosphatase [Streptococcus parauberis]PNY19747.1 Phosphorylated carbohydrates phosphatase [Streptococcus parauberis]
MISAIVFDMDGVIVDTEYLDYQLQSEYILSISKNSTPLTKEDFSSLVGRSGFDLQKRINQLACTNLSSEDFEVAFQQIERHKYHPETVVPIFRKDTVAILEWAKSQDIKLAVASSSPLDAILTVLDVCQIRHYFDRVTSGESFKESKPNPEIYLHTLQSLSVEANEAIAIEDSPSGIAAAKAAGMRVLAYKEERMLIDQSGADHILDGMSEIYSWLKKEVNKAGIN